MFPLPGSIPGPGELGSHTNHTAPKKEEKKRKLLVRKGNLRGEMMHAT